MPVLKKPHRAICVFCAVFFLVMQGPALAAKPGSVGFLYDQCKTALAESKDPYELQQSYCGAFAEGYFAGVLSANWMLLPDPQKDDPCYEDKKREVQRINNRFCSALEMPANIKEANPAGLLKKLVETVEHWMVFQDKNMAGDIRKKTVMNVLNTMVEPGAFCADLGKDTVLARPIPKINPALLQMTNMKSFLELKESFSLSAKYEGCKADIKAAGGDSETFKATRCGAELMGFATGVYSTAYLQQGRATPSAACEKEIDRLYRALDTAGGMCLSRNMDPLPVARAFVARYETLGPNEAKASIKDLLPGAVGSFSAAHRLFCEQ